MGEKPNQSTASDKCSHSMNRVKLYSEFKRRNKILLASVYEWKS